MMQEAVFSTCAKAASDLQPWPDQSLPRQAAQQPLSSKPAPLRQITRNFWYSSWSFRNTHRLVRILPRRVIRALASAIGHLAFDLCDERRDTMRDNLRVLSGLTGPELTACTRATFVNFIQMIPDTIRFAGGSFEEAKSLLAESDGLDLLNASRARGRGTVLITGHLGAWELGGVLLAMQGMPVTIVTYAEPQPELHRWRVEYRKRFGIRTITVGHDKFAFVEIIKILRQNGVVAILVDRPQDGGIPVQLAGRTSHFSPTPALLWKHTGATILPACVLAEPGGKYRCHLYPPIEMREASDPAEFQRMNAQRIADFFERLIRQHPEQFYNFVRLWV